MFTIIVVCYVNKFTTFIGDLPLHTDIKHSDVVPQSKLILDVRSQWSSLIVAVCKNDEQKVICQVNTCVYHKGITMIISIPNVTHTDTIHKTKEIHLITRFNNENLIKKTIC